jgi:glycosyltransferase involved in cell wall biosynthesis
MRLAAVTMARNEGDIIETAIRHNLQVVDHVLVIDHCSADDTPAIVKALIAEGLPVTLMMDTSLAFHQSRRTTEGARWLFQRQHADWVFPLDADELLKVPSREALERGLATVPEGLHVRVRLQTYVRDVYGDGGLFWAASFRRRLAVETYPQLRIAIHRSFLAHETQAVTTGNHYVLDVAKPREAPNYPGINADIVVIAHFPVRSARQVNNKAILGWLAHLATTHPGDTAHHWRELFEQIKAGAVLDDHHMLEVAVNYGMPRAQWQPVEAVALVEDPLPTGPAPRHSGMPMLEALPLLMAYAERMIREARPAPPFPS